MPDSKTEPNLSRRRSKGEETTPPLTTLNVRPDLPSEAHSPIAALWLQSRLDSASGELRPPGEARTLTVRNVKIAAQLVKLVGYRFLALLTEGQEWRIMLLVIRLLLNGVLPTAKIWANSRVLDMLQASFASTGVAPREAVEVVLVSTVISVAGDVIQDLLRDNDARVQEHLDTTLGRAYLATKLSLSLPTLASPYISALMYEAGVFAGFEMCAYAPLSGEPPMWSMVGPFDALQSAFALITNLINILSQVYLTYRALSATTTSTIGWSSLLLIGLSIAPTLLRAASGLLRPRRDNVALRKCHLREIGVKNLAQADGGSMQEIVLFGLKDWVLMKWNTVRRDIELCGRSSQRSHRTFKTCLRVAEEGVQNSFYLLLALQILPNTLSLGSIQLYQTAIGSLLTSLRSLSRRAADLINTIFIIAAFIEASELQHHPDLLRSPQYSHTELLDFDSYRVAGGMGLIATNLGFQYPGTNKPVLRDINLTIRPGSTLAIVGLNGGGKTTLVKALMGLYDCRGSLLLNGSSMASFDPVTVHRRTSCLFQDFFRYGLTLRENVGIGQVDKMGDDEVVRLAIARGDAHGVLDKVGMEGKLRRYGDPSADGDGDVQWETEDLLGRRQGQADGEGDGPGMLGWVKGLTSGKIKWAMGQLSGGVSTLLGISTLPFEGTSIATSESKDTRRPDFMTPPPTDLATSSRSACLSGGQWQRVALSRAFMRVEEADLVVFDEPSASLDPRAEAELFERIHALSRQRQCTTIYISHRFSTVKKADQIAVVEDGTIIECGSHADLMAREGRYCELYNIQKGGFNYGI